MLKMLQPEEKSLIKGEIADYFYDKDGILYSYSKNPVRTVKNISENIALVKSITGNKKVPLLIYLSNSPIPDKETRKYSAEQLPNVYTAMAMVSDKALSRLIMNVLFRLKTPPIPMRSFTEDTEAKGWLKQYL
jgi:hypothetical protein